MIDLNRKTNTISKQDQNDPAGLIILTVIPFAAAFWTLIELFL